MKKLEAIKEELASLHKKALSLYAPAVQKSVLEALAEIRRGIEELIDEERVVACLAHFYSHDESSSARYVVKAGFDPTAKDLHLGHTVLLQKLALFQRYGGDVKFLIGDFTAQIGDPSGKSATRKPLSKEVIKDNAKTYEEQVFKILDRSKTQVLFNSTWLNALGSVGMIELTSHFSVARMLERDDFAKRYKAQDSISMVEFIYPLLQGYDSVHLDADIECGGNDQKFNLLVGRTLQKAYAKARVDASTSTTDDKEAKPKADASLLDTLEKRCEAGVIKGVDASLMKEAGHSGRLHEDAKLQAVLLVPLLEGLDGVNKMSKSLDNYIGITEPPNTMYAKMLSISDTLMWRYYELLSARSLDEIEALKEAVATGSLHPKSAKEKLASEIVTRYYDKEAATHAKEEFDSVFSRHEVPSDIKEFSLSYVAKDNETKEANTGIWICSLLVDTGLAPSTSQARRDIQGGGVRVNSAKVEDIKATLGVGSYILQVGKRRFAKVEIARSDS